MYINFNEDKAIEFVETSIFTQAISKLATDDELIELQKELIQYPTKGQLIRDTGGLRKIRMAVGNMSKRDAARVVYFIASDEVIYLVFAYAKSVKENLTKQEAQQLKQLTQVLKSEVRS